MQSVGGNFAASVAEEARFSALSNCICLPQCKVILCRSSLAAASLRKLHAPASTVSHSVKPVSAARLGRCAHALHGKRGAGLDSYRLVRSRLCKLGYISMLIEQIS